MLVAFNRLLGHCQFTGLSCHAGANAFDNYSRPFWNEGLSE